MYVKIFENKTNHITVTTDGEECLRIYNEKFKEITAATNSYDQPFDILILDYKMPNIDGFEVAKRIISINPRQRIILASAYGKDIFEDASRILQSSYRYTSKALFTNATYWIGREKKNFTKSISLNYEDPT